MSDFQQPPLSVQPVISYPREAQVGKTYLMTIDLEPSGDEWHYEEEEYPIYCMLETSPLFSNKPVGEPAVVLHRFGGSYGAAKFLLTAAQEEMEGEIKVTLVNGWGVPVRVITLDDVKIRQEVNRALKIIGEHEQETFVRKRESLEKQFQGTRWVEDNQEVAALFDTQLNEVSEKRPAVKPLGYGPSLNIAIARLINTGTDNFAIRVVNAPYPSGYVLHDCVWPQHLTQVWQEWQQMFAGHSRLDISPRIRPQQVDPLPLELVSPPSGQPSSYSSRLMQYLGISLWRWVFDGPILGSLERSLGIAMGQHTRLQLRLEIRDPDLIALPWEIMQREPGQSVMALSQHVLFSRTTSEVEPLPYLRTEQALNILLILGEDEKLQLDKEAELLKATLTNGSLMGSSSQLGSAPCLVKTLLQPTPQELIQELDTKAYNVFFYAGHGEPGPDGGLLFLRSDMTLNGMELAQVLTSTGVKLAVFNACWGAQPTAEEHQAMPHSSLAEVLIRQGMPAVLGMRDEIADHESHSFIQAFAQALLARKPIDGAVAEARQQLLALYRFNQPAWTLPVLYMHPDYNGELIKSFDGYGEENEIVADEAFFSRFTSASLRSLSLGGQAWSLRPGITRIGRTTENDIVIPEPSVSKRHAEILCRNTFKGSTPVRTYYLQDLSTYGTTWILYSHGWQQIHRQEVPLESGMQLRFGSSKSQPWEFIIEE